MANRLDERNPNGETDGYSVNGFQPHVITDQVRVEPLPGTDFFLWGVRALGLLFAVPGLFLILYHFPKGNWIIGTILILMGFLPSIWLQLSMTETHSYFRRLEQDINRAASEIDIYIRNRAELMSSLVQTVNIGLEHEVRLMLGSARERSQAYSDQERNTVLETLNTIRSRAEAYPETRSNEYILELMRRDTRCVEEITAARVLYNDKVAQWNREIFEWPIKNIVAANNEYTTRLLLIAPAARKAENETPDFWGSVR